MDDERFRTEVAWREFYAAVLAFFPDSARSSFRPEMAALDIDTGPDADRRFDAWVEGRTGYPIVDAGMRQLAGEAWMHNRVRMITASFLVKDLHIDWRRGARLFMARLQDGDLASNQHNWQWVAGAGTDPAPFFRIFNPTTQGKKFDPDGTYVRRWVPELRDVDADHVHEPWKLPDGPPAGYPTPIVDHAEERRDALARYGRLRARKGVKVLKRVMNGTHPKMAVRRRLPPYDPQAVRLGPGSWSSTGPRGADSATSHQPASAWKTPESNWTP